MSHSPQKIRPAARLLKTIGQDLIKDVYAAIVELVKNSYDADSPDVIVKFNFNENKKRLSITVEDHGHGMSINTVINKWLVPATDDKLTRKRSEKGRVLQGRKGIGRFSAAILGENILLQTTSNGETTSLILDMLELDRINYLDELNIPIETQKTDKKNGTIIEIEKNNVTPEDIQELWTSKQLKKLLIELRSLTAPADAYQMAKDQGFDINHDLFDIDLAFENFPIEDFSNKTIKVKPFPILDLYDYKISGKIDPEGNANLWFDNRNIPGLPSEEIKIKIQIDNKNGQSYPGDIFVDLRVYDRDADSIENIIKRGLKDPDTGEFLGKQEARRILDEYYGIGIYREQFRIRPYGEQSFDWLDLDKKRVQNPSFKIGHNQVIGFVYVRPEEISKLHEKSARDGLMENGSYFGLISEVSRTLNELEVRRVQYREKSLKGGRARTLEDEISLLFDFDNTKREISKELDEIGISKSQQENITEAVGRVLDKEKQKKSEYVRKIRDTIAIYQGQATLGKITHVLLHEGRKHIKYISETVPRIGKWASQLVKNPDHALEEKMNERSEKTLIHAHGLASLFKKIEPLARTRRDASKTLNVQKELENSFAIYASELEEYNISFEIRNDLEKAVIYANEVDMITVFSNLIENSVFWVSHNKEKERKIKAHILKDNGQLIVEYKDTGPGFQGGNLELMFEPGYSMKPEGSGLGLALAGEAMSRIGGTIEAKHADEGAAFELTFRGNKNE